MEQREDQIFVGQLSPLDEGNTVVAAREAADYARGAILDIFGDSSPVFLATYDRAVRFGYAKCGSENLPILGATITSAFHVALSGRYGIQDFETTAYLMGLAGDYRAGENYIDLDERIKNSDSVS